MKKIFASNYKKNNEKVDNISDSKNDNLSRNFNENFFDNFDKKKDNIDIISCDDSNENDLNFRSINILTGRTDKSERKTKKNKMQDSASYNHDLISAHRLSRVSSLNNSINNFMSMNNSIYNIDNKSTNEEFKRNITIKKRKSKFFTKKN